MSNTSPSERTRVRRIPARGSYEREAIDAVLREGLVAHVGVEVDGQPFVLPMAYGFDGSRVLLHGNPGSRLLRAIASGAPVCITVTLLDGLVLARSMFHHSMNYRSVCVLGQGATIEGEQKLEALRVISEQLAPGRWGEGRGPNERELKGTLVVTVDAAEASAKSRTGPPVDDEEDYALPVWAGVLPFATGFNQAQPDPRLEAGIGLPERYR